MFNISLFGENFRISLHAIRINLLRTILTILIIAFGIMALVGILTAIESLKNSINSSFSSMGANTFTIESITRRTHFSGKKKGRARNYSFISFNEASRFKDAFTFPSTLSISVNATGMGTVKYKSHKTNSNIFVIGVDENYLATSGYQIEYGRNFTKQDVLLSGNYVIIGKELEKKLFKNTNALNAVISIDGKQYKVIGVLKEKGSSFGSAGDKICMLTNSKARQDFSQPGQSFSVHVRTNNIKTLETGMGEAEGIFRIIRGLKPNDETDFNVVSSNNLANMVIKNLSIVSLIATVIGFITLFGAAIGLMNIMLVSVTERTREIGIRKALGAKAKTIKSQFLFEAIIIGQLGGVLGIILGIGIGNILSFFTGSPFIIPWVWIISGVMLCFVVGIISGYFPAVKASKVDPIISLRYE
jgi:putative ABC transport system permease protein